MTFGELIAQLLGWLGNFVQFLISFCPIITWVRWNEQGVAYIGGSEPVLLKPGMHWYWPWRTVVKKHETTVFCLPVPPIPMETKDHITVAVGAVVTYQVTNILLYEVNNYDPDDNIRETAGGELCNIVKNHDWAELCAATHEGSRLENKFVRRMHEALEKYGVEVQGCRPNAQVRLNGAHHVFGMNLTTHGATT